MSTAAPTFRSSSKAATAGAVSLTPAEPDGAARDDVLILIVHSPTNAAAPVMADTSFWHKFFTFNQSPYGPAGLWWGRRTADAPNYQVDLAVSAAASAAVLAYSGAYEDGAPIYLASHIKNNGVAVTTHQTSLMFTPGPAEVVLVVLVSPSDIGSATPSSGAERVDSGEPTTSIYVFEAAAAAAGAYGPYTITTSSAVTSRVYLFSLKPALPGRPPKQVAIRDRPHAVLSLSDRLRP